MIINHNLTALNTQNSLNKNTAATQKSLQKLSSGLRINSAADDAAGLAISEKMKGQISGLEQASTNAQNGISLLQTAEGGLDQTHSILQRMRQLAVQSASDTNTSDDRGKIQSEVDQLAKEITRISNTTEFNTQNLLAGGMTDTFHIGANAGQNMTVSISAMDAQTLGVAGSVITAASVTANTSGLNLSSISRGITAGAATYVILTSVTAASITTPETTTVGQNIGNAAASLVVGLGSTFTGTTNTDYMIKVASTNTLTGAASPGYNEVTSVAYSSDYGNTWTTLTGDFHAGVVLSGVTLTFGTSIGTAGTNYTIGDTYTYSVQATKANLQLMDQAGNKLGASVDVHYGDSTATVGDSYANKSVGLQFAYSGIGSTSLSFFAHQAVSSTASVTQGKVLAAGKVVAGIDVSTQANANSAITVIDNAIQTVSNSRSQLGAYQNRMSNTIDNLNTSDENITSAQSRIADVDMSKEISVYQKNNVLQQAATSMLAHANQQPQTVLSLLQG